MKWLLFCLAATTVPVVKLFSALHLVIYAPVFYWVAKVLSRWLSLLPQPWRFTAFAGISLALVATAFLPVYGLGHHESPGVNLYRLFHSNLLR